ncbi:MAG: class I SAM-dependent methyltransferase [Chitinophagales bacterium]|nr:class I SAM-dependent methyltransferase [Chitinophagales bacterium]
MSNTERFSDRVQDYIQYRPDYPDTIIQALGKGVQLDKHTIVADIGSGTGISSIPFLKRQLKVFGIEPNKEMRHAAERLLQKYPNFISIDGTAEETHLTDKSVHLIFCGQAFHWFDKDKCKVEFERILKPNGHIALVWNMRNTNSPFQKDYERILYESIESYKFVNHRNILEEDIITFFSPRKMFKTTAENKQILDLNSLKRRLLSSSYCPKEGADNEHLMQEITILFNKYQRQGVIEFLYETQMFWC